MTGVIVVCEYGRQELPQFAGNAPEPMSSGASLLGLYQCVGGSARMTDQGLYWVRSIWYSPRLSAASIFFSSASTSPTRPSKMSARWYPVT